MFHPVGPQRPAIYWRRRLAFLVSVALVLLLLVVVVRAVTSARAGTPTAAGTSSSKPPGRIEPTSGQRAAGSASRRLTPPTRSATSTTTATTSGATTPAPATTAARTSGRPKSGPATATASTPPPPRPCTAADLRIAAQAQQTNFPAGSKPVLGLLVTDVGPRPCIQDFSDRQVLLRVYNGESRVWSSQDCGVQAGSQPQTLAVGRPVRVEMVWSGLSSQPGCGGPRQPVGAGTYTLYASLSGHDGTAATFTLS